MKHNILRCSETNDYKEWEQLCLSASNCDIYFFPQYIKIYEQNGEGEGYCFVYYDSEDSYVLLPFIRRKINDLDIFKDLNETYYDIISPYGYGGPFIANNADHKDENLCEGFLEEFNKFCAASSIVTEFCRLHPLLQNHDFLRNHIQIQARNETVYIDLTQERDTLWKEIRKGHKSSIKKAQKYNIEIIEDKTFKHLDVFVNLYSLTMNKRGAKSYYYFPRSLFKNTIKFLNGNVKLFIARYNSKIISAALFMHYGDYIHYHFSGSDPEYLYLCSNNLLIYEVALWAKGNGFKLFHLGGGVDAPEDSLFRFKSGFSKHRSTFFTYAKVYNKSVYEYLCKKKIEHEKQNNIQNNKSEYFPIYRR
jgi:predicted N-acyltransferase